MLVCHMFQFRIQASITMLLRNFCQALLSGFFSLEIAYVQKLIRAKQGLKYMYFSNESKMNVDLSCAE